jgi:23S rRNA (adenine2030-N6)-methyltransferase
MDLRRGGERPCEGRTRHDCEGPCISCEWEFSNEKNSRVLCPDLLGGVPKRPHPRGAGPLDKAASRVLDAQRMNYRHAYHAGNFADVLKHAILSLVLVHMAKKPTPFRVIDTHAGIGMYDLTSEAAEKTGEWKGGIGRLMGSEAAPLPAAVASLLAPYLGAVRACNPDGGLRRYPGSPCLALALMRAHDRLVANELHPEDAATLARTLASDRRAKVLALDGWLALKAQLPPKERRGIILVDPPFEEAGELERIGRGLQNARRRFSGGVYLLWYPIKDPRLTTRFLRSIAAVVPAETLAVELLIRAPADVDRLNGSGLVILNAPFTLESDLAVLMPVLAERLADGGGACTRVERIR